MAIADYIDKKPVVDTTRLRLRPLRMEDVPALEEWMPDRSIYAYWGKGPGKTDKNPELRRLQAEVDVRNAASRRMLEKCGYRQEGLIRQGKMVSVWCDYCIYGILASDASSSIPSP